MSDILWLDLETYSATPIKHGTDNYSRDTEITLFAYSLNDGPVRVWDCTTGAPIPADLARWLADEEIVLVAHNAAFEQAVLGVHGYRLPIARWRCTMAQALAHSLPGALEKLCSIFNVDDDLAKLKDGKALVKLFCMPQGFKHTLKREDFDTPKAFRAAVQALRDAWPGRATRHTHPEEWARFVHYCANDVESMRAVQKSMPNWNYGGAELELWHLDQRINQRGVPIDVDLIRGAIITADRTKATLAAETVELTDGTIGATTQRNALLELLNGHYALNLPDLRAATVERLLKSDVDLPPVVTSLLQNRLAASSTSVSKYEAFDRLTGPDGRLRNTLQFCGAMRTGRWAGRGVQLQNLPRPVLKQKVIDAGIEAIKLDCADLIYDNPMELLSSAVRGCIIPTGGNKLVVADLSNIEGRMLAWLSGETWKLKAFADYDTCLGTDGNWYSGDQIRDAVLAGRPIDLKLDKKGEPTRKGHDLYALAYAKAFQITPEAVMENKKNGDGAMRQVGKVMELACGFQGSVGAFATFAIAYGIDLDEMARNAISSIPRDVLEAAYRSYKWAMEKGRDYGMREQTYKVCFSFVRMWRTAHASTSAYWPAVENAVRSAILNPNREYVVGKCRVKKTGTWLRIVLPSGRTLCYPAPRLEGENEKISYMGVNQFTRQWCRLHTYGGKLCIARDTPVLTGRGWVPIQDVNSSDTVWDGIEWVACGGNINNGESEVIKVFGALMTADHEVLTDGGWKRASQSERYNRATCRLPDGHKVPRFEWPAVYLASKVRLRDREGSRPVGLCEAREARNNSVMRMHADKNYRQEELNPRYDRPSCVRSMAVDDRPLRASNAPSMGQVRCTRDNCLRFLEGVFSGLLGRYGANVPTGPYSGQDRKRIGVFQSELPVGDEKGTSGKHQKNANTGNTLGVVNPTGDSGTYRDKPYDCLLPSETGRIHGTVGGAARYITEVFDLLNCGPRNRFVIATEGGLPLIVHNCENITQAASRDVIGATIPEIEDYGYQILSLVHDEDITETPDTDRYSSDHLAALMASNPGWAAGLPLAAAGFEAYRYRKD